MTEGCDVCYPRRSQAADTLSLYRGFPYLPTPLCCSPVVEDERLLSLLVSEVAVYTVANGLMMMKLGVPAPVPCTLLPTPFPRDAYHRLQLLAVTFNRLYQRVSSDYSFLLSCLAETARADPFIARLLAVHEAAVLRGGRRQSLVLSINRSDYMMHATQQGGFVPQQVEFNTISAGMACLSSRVAAMHRYLVERHAPHYADSADLPANTAMEQVVQAMADACRLYDEQMRAKAAESNAQPSALLMVVQPNEWNLVDQQLLAYSLWKQHGIPVIRKTLAQVHDEAHIDARGQLVLDAHAIAVTYFRAGYSPRDYAGEAEWEALLRIEQSLSVKCPSVAYHLAGCKRVQQALTSPAVLERFLAPDEAAMAHSSFTQMWQLPAEAEETRATVAMAMADPDSFVLKPQREGGGNNLWGGDMVERLRTATPEQLAAYILMRRINAPAATAAGVRHGALHKFRGINEMGVFGVHVADGEAVHSSAAAGYLLRTKDTGNHEGGISAGSGFIDSVVLV